MQTAGNFAKENERRARVLISAVVSPPRYSRQAESDEALKALAISIRHLGLLQPITVRVTGPYRYELVSGERRLEACRQLGFTHIDAYLLPMAHTHDALLSLMDNLRREDLHYLEEAEGCAAALESGRVTRAALSSHIGKSEGYIARKLSLLCLDESVREALFYSKLSERHARLLLRLSDAKLQREAVFQMAEMRLDVSESKALVSRIGGAALLEETDDVRPARQVKSFIRDRRLYVNAISDIVRQMSDAGMPADMETTEEDGQLLIRVRMRKEKG